MKTKIDRIYVYFTVLIVLSGAMSFKIQAEEFLGKLKTYYTQEDREREVVDRKKYPNFYKFLDSIKVKGRMVKTDPRNRHLIKSDYFYDVTQEDWEKLLIASAKDRITIMRAFSLLGKEIKKRGIVIAGTGKGYEGAVNKLRADIGLALPAYNIGICVWSPNTDSENPEMVASILCTYTHKFLHRFPSYIIPADLNVGGEEVNYHWGNKKYTQTTVSTDIYYGKEKGIGFQNMKGIGGKKHGFLGFIQTILPFLPDAVNDIIIDEENEMLLIVALINTEIDNYENEEKYIIKLNAEKTQRELSDDLVKADQ